MPGPENLFKADKYDEGKKMQPKYVIRISQRAFESFTGLDYEIETEFPLFEQRLLRVEPLQFPAGSIFHVPFRYGSRQQ